jgi:predicted helicase
VAERQAANRVKSDVPILVIMGNPPYKRLRAGEIDRLVGPDMKARWQDLKQPVIDAGYGRSLNAFPDLYVAFYRWALWRLFEAKGALGRGVLAFITNRAFLTGRGFGGLRKMLRDRFDHIRIIDLRGDNQSARPAIVPFR